MRTLLSAVILLVLLIAGCESDTPQVEEPQQKKPSMTVSSVEFTDQEQQTLRELKIAIYRNKIITDAQPPITDAQLTEIEKKIGGKVPPELVALWKTSFGGELDYSYEAMFGDYLHPTSLRELYYPASSHYRTLHGWIERELEAEQEVAEERKEPIPKGLSLVPFAGFEYLDRFYVAMHPDEYGEVIAFAGGIPWKGRLNEDSATTVAKSVTELIDQLCLDEDPFDKESSEYADGKDLVERIGEIEAEHPELARKLKELFRSSIFNWRPIITSTDFAGPMSDEQTKALRLALKFAVRKKDVGLIDELHKQGAPFNQTLAGRGGVLTRGMDSEAFQIVNRLLELNVDLGKGLIINATGCSDELLLRLIKRGVRFDEEAIYSAAHTGAKEGAIALAVGTQVVQSRTIAEIVDAATTRASRYDEDAGKVETGALGSYLTADQYRERAKALRAFADELRRRKVQPDSKPAGVK